MKTKQKVVLGIVGLSTVFFATRKKKEVIILPETPIKISPTIKMAPSITKLGKAKQICKRTNPDGSSTSYSGQGGSNPCPYGGVVTNGSFL